MSKTPPVDKKHTLLIVEDQQDLLESLTDLFASWDYNVVQAQTLQDALSKVVNQKFSVIFLDIMLQKTNGLKVLEQVRRNVSNVNFQTPIILHSASIEMDIFDQYKGDFNDAIVKPSDVEHIKKKIEYWVNKKHVSQSHNAVFVNEYLFKKGKPKK